MLMTQHRAYTCPRSHHLACRALCDVTASACETPHRTCALVVVLSFGFSASVWAACSSPAGNAGAQMYAGNYGVMAYCNGTNWISMAGGVSQTVNTTGDGATPEGSSADVQFNSSGALA